MTFTPTPEQTAIISAATNSSDNLLISALAGAAKTSTLVMVANALPKTSMLCISFNKRIATEMKERLPANCTSMTLNGLGHRVWSDTIGKRLTLNTKKTYELLTELVNTLGGAEKQEAYERFGEMLKAIGFGKTCGYVPTGEFPSAKGLFNDQEFFDHLDEEPTDIERYLIREVSLRSMELAKGGVIDFDDQLLMPTVFPSSFPQYPLVLIDEAQDLSALNHAMIRKFAKKRLIAVGDECQSIYGFRGAHQNSMDLLKQTFSMRTLLLSVSFRCPISVVEAARWRAPHMEYPEWAKPGEVRSFPEWSAEDIPMDAVIICRNNAPLFQMAMRLIKAKRYPELVGNDIGKALLKVMKKFGPPETSVEDALKKLAAWKSRKLARARDPGPVEDQASCIEVFFEDAKNLGDAIIYAESLFSMVGPVKLMTGHKAKGLEFETVLFLDPFLCRDNQQDKNLRYVIQTRAKQNLYYVFSEGWQS